MSQRNTAYAWHPQHKKKLRYALSVVAVAMAAFVWLGTRAEQELTPRALASLFVIAAIFSLIEQDTHVDPESRTIVREGRLFGRLRVWRWRHALSDFSRVAISRQSNSEGPDTVFVGLRRRNGRLMAVRYFEAGTGHRSVEAEQVARSLAEATGLQLRDDLA